MSDIKTNKHLNKQRGFTIIELLIVIVVIAILATITIIGFNGIQNRARDTQRKNDVAAILKALELYKIDNGDYPPAQPNPGSSTWEISTDPGFLSSLSDYTGNKTFKAPSSDSRYSYHRFSSTSYGCPSSMGSIYMIWVKGMKGQSSPDVEVPDCFAASWFPPIESSAGSLVRTGTTN